MNNQQNDMYERENGHGDTHGNIQGNTRGNNTPASPESGILPTPEVSYGDALAGTRTERNLTAAAAEEAKAHTKYELYSGAAYEEGYATVGDSLWDLSHQEKEHSEMWYDYLGKIGNTTQNLQEAIATETYEAESMYGEFARVAEEEGFSDIAEKFRMVGSIENNHRDILRNILDEMRDGALYGGGDDNTVWFCTNCGYAVKGKEAPAVCPVCSYGRGYFIRYGEN